MMLVGLDRALHAHSPVTRIHQSSFGSAVMPDSEFVIPRHSPRQTRNTAIIQNRRHSHLRCNDPLPTRIIHPQPCMRKPKRKSKADSLKVRGAKEDEGSQKFCAD